ncbi:MAG TPA: hypothetical protein VFH95_10795 [Candidatus Kapabacteria bacterium]|nr:hypothetical protein [Candidatus Kapabacteria bacterium]
MTQLLQTAISEVQKLPEREQNVLAALILEEMIDERKWDAAFSKSQDQLEQLAAEALEELHSGKATPLEFR